MIRDFWISINEKYQRNKTVIWFIVIVLILFFLVMNNIDKLSKTIGGSGNSSTTSGSVSTEEKISEVVSNSNDDYSEIIEKTKDVRLTNEGCIKLFVQLCNSGKVDTAYEFLNDLCKKDMYPTKQSFIDTYYSVIFKTSKDCEITRVKNDTYRVRYINDMISTGGNGNYSGEITDYITVTDGKINISGYIDSTDLNVTSIAPYFTVYVDKKQTFMDHVIYSIRVKNNTKADIYINSEENNNLYIKDVSEGIHVMDSNGLFENDYLVPAGSEKSFTYTFNIDYAENSKVTEICFGNIIIKNKEYLDSTMEVRNPATGEVEYARVKTNYPERYNWSIKF